MQTSWIAAHRFSRPQEEKWRWRKSAGRFIKKSIEVSRKWSSAYVRKESIANRRVVASKKWTLVDRQAW